ncbi:S41 family peptidase [Leptolyngbya cf. ectocarpi LEGE 11479]|uniref:S41 family peptidase n=1 Tax=Leptolyngbya cf. ectocarpi LEGE 11479 TaxID=1828722 RepID=A0A928ZYV5_LEPEC|nr:S41 family peptidase [Leptolyngbya ectocarpi]MBE9069903.1 S41 family peptidase [Leptolyngbya cf. ectocarpi LEGE 11479]
MVESDGSVTGEMGDGLQDIDLDRSSRSEILEAVAEALDRYAFPEAAAKAQVDIRRRLEAGGYGDIVSAHQLAETLTNQLQTLTCDRSVRVYFSPTPLPNLSADTPPTAEELAYQQQQSQRRNFDINRVERLGGNLGFLQLYGFEPPEFAGTTLAAAMTCVAHTEGLIIDLRYNRGGSPAMVALLCSYLLSAYPAVHLNDVSWPAEQRIQQSWTVPHVGGPRYLDRPVYILTGPETATAAEEFAYTLKQLKRATLIGETTAGKANPGAGQRLHDHFWMFLPTGQVLNSVTGGNWEGSGVLPDFKVPVELALKVAHYMGLTDLSKQAQSPSQELSAALDTVKKQLDQMQQDLISQLGGLR